MALDRAGKTHKLPVVTLTSNQPTATMPRAKTSRKRLFKAALAIAGMTAEQWAAAEDVTAGHLSHVLNGRESASLTAKIDAFTAKHLSANAGDTTVTRVA